MRVLGIGCRCCSSDCSSRGSFELILFVVTVDLVVVIVIVNAGVQLLPLDRQPMAKEGPPIEGIFSKLCMFSRTVRHYSTIAILAGRNNSTLLGVNSTILCEQRYNFIPLADFGTPLMNRFLFLIPHLTCNFLLWRTRPLVLSRALSAAERSSKSTKQYPIVLRTWSFVRVIVVFTSLK